MSTGKLRFKEIEHKYVVDERFDLPQFRRAVEALGPSRTSTVDVRDRYFLTEGGRARGYLIRHRYDSELHHLTLKAVDSDTEVRVEVNLDLGHHAGSQEAQVDAFMDRLGVVWRGVLQKQLEVWYFTDCEVVYYQAATAARSIRCVEFEAKSEDSLAEALATLERFERATGFAGATRSRLSLPQILFPDLADALARRTG